MKRPIRVLQILEATVGGTRRHLVSLVAGLDKTQFTVEVAAPIVRHGTNEDISFVAEIRATGVILHHVDMYREIRPFSDLRAFFILADLIRQKQYDIIHTHSSKAGFLGRFAARLNRLPVVYTPNGFYFLDASHLTKKSFYLCLERMAGLFTDTLITVSPSERETVLRHRIVSSQRVVTIPNAVDLTQFAPNPEASEQVRKILGIEPGAAVIGTVSRYIAQKDPFTLVRAIRLVADQYPDLHFLWCGEGELKTETEQLAHELGVASHFCFLGFRSDVQAIMNACDLFVLASIFEGLPYTLLEVMALGKPVVATAVVGNQDLVTHNDNGLLVPPRDPAALAQAILTLLHQPERRRQMGERGRQRIQTEFSMSRMVAETEAVYYSLMR